MGEPRKLSHVLRPLVGERAWASARQRRTAVSLRLLFTRAYLYRHTLLRGVAFVGVTGSAGKTTTKELLAAMLSTKLTGQHSPQNFNVGKYIARTVLQVRPSDDYCVVEMGVSHPPRPKAAGGRAGSRPSLDGSGGGWTPLDRPLALVKPRVAVVTTVGMDHIDAFGTIDAIAAEKEKLVASLPPDGVAVLNADDPRVLAMRARCRARVMTYGLAASADVRAEDVQARWPERLSFTVVHAGRSHRVQTQLCGLHWVPSVLAALTAALAMGISLADAAAAVPTVPPFPGRLSPEVSPDGVTFLHDAKAPLWSIPLAFDLVKQARAPRKIIVLGTMADIVGNSRGRYRAVARLALDAGDHVLLVGPNAGRILRDRQEDGAPLHAAPTIEAARHHLQRLLRPGDLVLLKGSEWELGRLAETRIPSPGGREEPGMAAPPRATAGPVHVIVGLGNPGERYAGTPHNVGQRALDLVAESLQASWVAEEEAMVARVDHPGGTCYLVKPLTRMNETGLALRRLADRMGFGAAESILLHDDIELPAGAVRTRMAGSDGGHRGVRSVLEAFATFEVRRVKIGVGRPSDRANVARHVTSVLGPEEVAVLDKACVEAAARIRELAGVPRPGRAKLATSR